MRSAAQVTPGLRRAPRQAAKGKISLRLIDGESAHTRSPGAGCATLRASAAQSIFSLDAALQDLVTEQQPKVAIQHPIWGSVSTLLPVQSTVVFTTLAGARFQGCATDPLLKCETQTPSVDRSLLPG